MSFRIKLVPLGNVSPEELRRNIAQAEGLPRARRGVHAHPVAVVGGGPSAKEQIEEIRCWPGDIWGINHTAGWLTEQGIDCCLYSIDAKIQEHRPKRALLATCCPVHEGAEVFDLVEHAPGGLAGGTTTASRAPSLALRLGYPGAVFFGCEGSWRDGEQYPDASTLIVRAAGGEFLTDLELLYQCEHLAEVIREFPVFSERSGGLLRALVEDPDWSIVAVSAKLKEHLIETNGDSGLYDQPYRPRWA